MDKAIVNKARTIRISVGMFNKIKKLNDMQRELVLKLGHEPSKQELAKYMHTSVNNIEQICEANKLPISINYKIGEKKESELGEFIPSSENLEDEALKSNYDDIIKKLKKCNLNNREILILTLRYGLNGDNPKTLEEIGKYLKITRQWVRQIEKNVLNRLRNPYNAKYFATDESLIRPVNNQNDDSHASYIKKNHY